MFSKMPSQVFRYAHKPLYPPALSELETSLSKSIQSSRFVWATAQYVTDDYEASVFIHQALYVWSVSYLGIKSSLQLTAYLITIRLHLFLITKMACLNTMRSSPLVNMYMAHFRLYKTLSSVSFVTT
jgi:hypothetical protein